MLPELQRAGALLAAKRHNVSHPNVLAEPFPEKLALVRDTAPLKAAFCTRRAAKSFSAGLDFIDDSFDRPYAHYLLLMTVRAQAKRDFWQDVLKPIERKYGVGMKFNENELTATLPNSATID